MRPPASPSTARSAWPLAARLARREVSRRPWRTLLVALLVAVPVAAMMFAAVAFRTMPRTPEAAWQSMAGTADAQFDPGFVAVRLGAPNERLTVTYGDLLPGSRMVSYQGRRSILVRTDGGRRARPEVTDLPLGDPLTVGIIRLTSGRAVSAPGEVVLSRVTAGDLAAAVGDVLTLQRPMSANLTVVGIGERTEWYGAEFMVVDPTSPLLPGDTSRRPDIPVRHLVDLPDAVTTADLDAWAAAMADRSLTLAPHWAGRTTSPAVFGTYPDDEAAHASQGVRWTWLLGAVAFTVVGIVIASAFASGARRQLTTLGQLAANGAAPAVLRRVLLLQGTWTGVAGAVLGAGLGAAALAAAAPWREIVNGRDTGPWVVRIVDLVPILVIGVVAATVAALIPARTIARVPVLAALAGRRPLASVPRWLPVSGLVTVAAGLGLFGLSILGATAERSAGATVWALTGIAGGVAILLGACAVTPALVGLLEPAAGRLSGSWRLAARSLARQRTRTSGVVSAVAATAALAIAGSAIVLGADAHAAAEAPYQAADEVHVQTRRYGPYDPGTGAPGRTTPLSPPVAVVERIAADLAGSQVLRLSLVTPRADLVFGPELLDFAAGDDEAELEPWSLFAGDGSSGLAVLADVPATAVYRLTGAERAALGEHGALYFSGNDGTATVPLVPFGTGFGFSRAEVVEGGGAAVPVPVLTPPLPEGAPVAIEDVTVVDGRNRSLGKLPRLLLSPARARSLGFSLAATDVVVRAPESLTRAQRNLVADIAFDVVDQDSPLLVDNGSARTTTNISVPPSGGRPSALLLDGILSGVALFLTLFVVATALALAAAETRDERDTLAVVGASPAALRRTSARKAALLTGLGAALAVPVGFLPVVVFTRADPGKLELIFPWRIVGLLAVAVPLVAYAVTTVGSALALRLRPVRISTMTLE